ncbi:penicillin-binding protein 1B [Methylococcus sp. EFPC2]|uniref:penicillin-binding protein 1B n=1 Tax=Methylococcus sp. EFPC2 TaxID=2812648 RepID=UPI00196871BF|nr:penicillin-binding protein 1B [Methylococcus sp. EFPC2]QSA97444.1 penicillin-binding protein 1B [Methylococcus sp. EFPC2]
MPNRRQPPATPVAKPPKAGWPAWLKRLLFLVVPPLLVALVAYVGYQDYSVRQQFEGKRWALPARVYASPTELFADLPMDAGRLTALLDELKYRSDPTLSTQATYARKGNEVRIKTREFRFADKSEPARDIRVRLADGRVEAVDDVEAGQPAAILRLEPVQIGSFYPALKEDRVLIKLDQAPKVLINALLATEDRDFYNHFGISPRAILRAMWANLLAGGIVQGGSTLTQQLVKNFFLSSEQTWWRKINEAVMALVLEARYSKDEILEAYLNEIYLGQDGARAVHGFGLACQYYFSRSLDELELHHIALLVTLVRGASYYDPFKNPERVLKRRNLVLDEMAEQAYITTAQANAAKAKPLDTVKNPHQAISRYPAFLDLVKRQLQAEYRNEDLTSEGLRIFTTLDVEAQQQLEAAIAATMPKLDKQTRTEGLETAAVVTRRSNGEIAALVGSRDAQASGFNRALDSVRQIGSLYKPVVYLTALSDPQKYTLATPLQDTALRIPNPGGGPWSPHNYDNKEHGAVPLHSALAHSYNLATVRLGMDVGVAHTLRTLRNLGVERPLDTYPATLLGTGSLSPMEVTQMYQTLASDGFITPLRAIQAVVSQEGQPLQRYALNVRQALDPGPVYLTNTALQEVLRDGTARSAYNIISPELNAAGKTGTTNDLRDSWFAGFTGDYLGVVWVGRDDNQPAKLTGAQGALQIWAQTLRKISREPLDLIPPDDIETVWIDRDNGLRASESCPSASPYPFIHGSAPKSYSPCAGGQPPPAEESGGFRLF